MKTATRILMCLVLMGLFTAATGCDETTLSDFGDVWYGDEDGDWGGDWGGSSSSGTFFSDYGGSVSWW